MFSSGSFESLGLPLCVTASPVRSGLPIIVYYLLPWHGATCPRLFLTFPSLSSFWHGDLFHFSGLFHNRSDINSAWQREETTGLQNLWGMGLCLDIRSSIYFLRNVDSYMAIISFICKVGLIVLASLAGQHISWPRLCLFANFCNARILHLAHYQMQWVLKSICWIK